MTIPQGSFERRTRGYQLRVEVWSRGVADHYHPAIELTLETGASVLIVDPYDALLQILDNLRAKIVERQASEP